MSTAPIFNVFRWGALASGVVYGFFHNITLSNQAAEKKASAEYAHKEDLIKQAKAKYAELHPKPVSKDGAVDFEDPNFDLADYISKALA
ncbi:uncharacterized protein SAPINGB_P001750 [Magnusiomyces paraingens]|uniref:ATP synthase F(0) complex subunit e, mitochondrial n=1 Tax=Magnusiomyces paraingens TaxID=2606893 RepID=A0A5E8BI17_9ASCO|nr:uncharacterized protein SAPINGB_P001750 [Saprochaete ingens]VVT48379.1 unnamed protein product [Saprochaete ingens]